ncbi:hypothetical protein, partial [Pseudomonas aeruginosa]
MRSPGTPLSFDMAFQEIFSTLCGGGELQLISNRERMDPSALLHVLERRQVQRVLLPFVALQRLAEASNAQGAGAHAQRVGGLGEALQGDEGQQHALDLAAFEDMQQRGGVHPLAVGDELQLAAAAQRGEDLLEGHV